MTGAKLTKAGIIRTIGGIGLTTPIDIISTGVIDDFEDQNLIEYQGDTGSASIISNPGGYEGSYVLSIDTAGFEQIYSESGLDRYPQMGDKFEYKCNLADDTHRSYFAWCVSGGTFSNGYVIELKDESGSGGGESLEIRKRESGNASTLNSTNVTFPSQPNRYRVVVDTGEGGSITATLYDDETGTQLGKVSATDATYQKGGVGFGSDDSGQNIWDIAKITSTTSGTGAIDTWEDGGNTEYSTETFLGIGGPGNVGTSTNTVNSGTYSGFVDAGGNGAWMMASQSGLDRYPQKGDTFEGYCYSDTSNDWWPVIIFGYKDSNNHYAAYWTKGVDVLRIEKISGGTRSTVVESSTVTGPPANSWFKSQIKWSKDGDITFTVFDGSGNEAGSVTGNDTDFSGGGFGVGTYDNDGSHRNYYDDWEITSSGDTAEPTTSVTNGGVLWYPVEDGDDNSTVYDHFFEYADSTRQNGTVNGATQTTDAKTDGWALDYSSGDYIDLTGTKSDFSFVHNGSSYTLTAWVKFDPTADAAYALMDNTDGTNDKHGFWWAWENRSSVGSPEAFKMAVNGSSNDDTVYSVTSNSGVIPDSNYHHTAVKFDGSTVTFYVDGNKVGSTSVSGTFDGGDATHDLRIGELAGSNTGIVPYVGKLDDVRIYNEVKTQSEIQSIIDEALVTPKTSVTSGLKTWLSFTEDDSTATAYDYAHEYADSTRQNADLKGPGLTTDAKTDGYAYDFVRSNNDYMVLPDASAFEEPQFSLCVWIKPQSSGVFQQFYDYLDEGGSGDGTRLIINNNDTIGFSVPGNQISSSTTISTGTWYHVAGTFDGSTGKLYIDGTKENSASTGSISYSNLTQDPQIGRRIKTSVGKQDLYYDGPMDDFRYYDRAISQSEIQSIINEAN